ncbi:unnamed protein product [Callosobruchus maculatus]|uniref:RRM domain-containing protein n=1 Tax=Callosobruchus maculatus TaxID=64391 RepID=A0A653D1F5_CALMS|nr:unnamed protein product [Callosobruchus maculatus]
MSKVKVLYVRNLTQEITEEKLKASFEAFGKVERVKKIKDYAFIHFEDRDNAVKAMEELDGKEMGGSHIEVSLAKPPSDKKKKEEILRARERRMMQMMQVRGGSMMPGTMPLRGPPGQAGSRGSSGMRGGPMGRGDYDYDYDYYGYGDYRGGYSDPYYDDFYRYEDYYYDYQSVPTPARGRGRQPPPVWAHMHKFNYLLRQIPLPYVSFCLMIPPNGKLPPSNLFVFWSVADHTSFVS